MTTFCMICQKDWDYHSEAEANSCGKKMILRLQSYFEEIDELSLK